MLATRTSERTRPPSWAGAFSTLVAVVLVLGFAWAYLHLPIVVTGDGFGVYFPTAWGLAGGEGTAAFKHLMHGAGRAPLYPVLLSAAEILTGSTGAAVRWLAFTSIIAVAGGILVAGKALDQRAHWGLAFVFLACSNAFLHAAFASTPDLTALALVLWSLGLALHGRGWSSGALLGLATLARWNYGALLPVILVVAWRTKDANMKASLRALAGFIIPMLPWMVIGVVVRGQLIWIPGGAVSAAVFHESLSPLDHGLGAIFDAPRTVVPPWLHRLFVGGPVEVATMAMPWFIAAAGILGLMFRRSPQKRTLLVATGVLWLALSAIHFESRYYVMITAVASIGAAIAVSHLLDGRNPIVSQSEGLGPLRRVQALAFRGLGIAAVVGTLVVGWPSAESFYGRQALGAEHIESFRRLRPALLSLEGCIGADEPTWRLSPLRFVLHEVSAEGRLCCCGPTVATGGFVDLSYGRKQFDPEHVPSHWAVLPVEAGPKYVTVYRVGASLPADQPRRRDPPQ